ncbi:MAG: hypothetical protein M3Y27_15860 [Acidobacteriota bacterium]|nr:hypothetical protein [Acidobacteriota bacterium]
MRLSRFTKLAYLALSALPGSIVAATCEAGTPNAMLQNASPKNWVLLALGGPTDVTVSGSSIISGLGTAFVGLAETGSLTAIGPSSIQSEVLLNMAGRVSRGSPSYIGPVTQDDDSEQYLSMARKDAISASECAAILASTINLPTVSITNKSMTIAAEQTLNVVNLRDLILENGSLTLSSHAQHDPPPTLIVNISGNFQMSGSSRIVLEGTLDETHVLFNVTGAGDDVALSGEPGRDGHPTTQISGVLLAPARTINLSCALVSGTVLGGAGSITVGLGSQVIRHFQ